MALAAVQKKQKNQRRMPRQARARQKVEAVLDACTQVLAVEGYQGTTVLALSLESGVAVPTLYQYFENKEAIFIAWLERSVDQVLAQVAVAPPESGKGLDAYIDSLVQVGLASVALLRPAVRSLLVEMPQMLSSQVMATIEAKTVAMVKARFADQIRQLPVKAVELHLQILVRMIVGYFLLAVLHSGRQLEVEQESEEIARMVKAYLGNAGINVAG